MATRKRPGKQVTIPEEIWPFFQNITPIPGSKDTGSKGIFMALVHSWFPFDEKADIAETWMAFFSEAYRSGSSVYSMWTLDWGDVGDVYRKELAALEAKSSSEVRRIIAHRPLSEVLDFLQVTAQSFNRKLRPASFELSLPRFWVPSADPAEFRTELTIFDSESVCPKLEIVVRLGRREWKTYATLTFQEKSKTGASASDEEGSLYLLTTGSQSLCEDLLLDVWRVFSKRCVTISSWDTLWAWLISLDRVTRGFSALRWDPPADPVSAREQLHDRSEKVIGALGDFNWDDTAPLYDEVVRNPPEGGLDFFKNYFDGELRVVVDELARFASEGQGPVTLLDFGCGTGGLLERLNEEIGPTSKHHPKTGDVAGILGVDSSVPMLERAHAKLGKNGRGTRLRSFEFPCDLRQLGSSIASGKIRSGSFKPVTGLSVPDSVFIQAFNASRHFAWSANVIPNVRKASRAQFVRCLYDALGPGDRLLLTTYDGNQFGDGLKQGFAGQVYSHTHRLTGDPQHGSFFPGDRLYVNPPTRFFSYWPTHEELAEVLSLARFTSIRPGVASSKSDPSIRVAYVVGTKPTPGRSRLVGNQRIERQ